VRVVAGKAPDDSERALLGVNVGQKQPHPFTISIGLEKIGGPSAGLMFALGIIDKLDPADLTGGTFVAGTGTIDEDGAVGPIGGIPQKLVAARRAGATVFLTPAANCAEAAARIPAGLRLVKVTSLDDALGALRQLREKTGSPAGCTS
jgi:PDZ domain-containing protein